MRGYALIRSNPYMAKSDGQGRFLIAKLPLGKHTFVLWHERVGYIRNVAIGPHKTSRRGRLTLDVTARGVKLPTLRLPPALFE